MAGNRVMATTRTKEALHPPVGVQELQLALIREMAAYRDWDLRVAARELTFMRKICRKIDWGEAYEPLVGNVLDAVKFTARTVRDEDTTLITSAHTRLEHAIFALRDQLYA